MDRELTQYIERSLGLLPHTLTSWFEMAKLVGSCIKRDDPRAWVILNEEARRITIWYETNVEGKTESSSLLFAEAPDGRVFSAINGTTDEGNTPDEMCQVLYYTLIAYIQFKKEGVVPNVIPGTNN